MERAEEVRLRAEQSRSRLDLHQQRTGPAETGGQSMSCRCIDCVHYVTGHKMIGHTIIFTYNCTKKETKLAWLSIYATRDCPDFQECEPE